MGPISMAWFRERGLTRKVSRVIEEDDFLVDVGAHQVGDVLEYDEVTTYYCGGRIDIRDSNKEGYDGWNEYSLPPMHGEDFNDFGDWLEGFQTHELWEFDKLIACYESASNTKIRWAEDTWFKCHECGLITDLRKTKQPVHKLDCTRNWNE
jgi:hypothetical protein